MTTATSPNIAAKTGSRRRRARNPAPMNAPKHSMTHEEVPPLSSSPERDGGITGRHHVDGGSVLYKDIRY